MPEFTWSVITSLIASKNNFSASSPADSNAFSYAPGDQFDNNPFEAFLSSSDLVPKNQSWIGVCLGYG